MLDMGLRFIVDGGVMIASQVLMAQALQLRRDLCDVYPASMQQLYGHALNVFDGYYGSSTKDISVEHAGGDADHTICMLAFLSAIKKPPALVAEDSDVFQRLIHHADVTDIGKVTILTKYAALKRSTSVFMFPFSST